MDPRQGRRIIDWEAREAEWKTHRLDRSIIHQEIVRCTTCSGVYVPNGTFIHLLPTSHFPCLPLFPFSQDQFYPKPLHFFTRSFIMILYTFCLTNIRSRIRSKVLKDHIPSPRAEDLSISSQSPRTSSGLFYSQYHTY